MSMEAFSKRPNIFMNHCMIQRIFRASGPSLLAENAYFSASHEWLFVFRSAPHTVIVAHFASN